MRKFLRARNVVVILVAFMLVLTSISAECFAKGWDDDGLRHIDVYVNGTITVDTQVNGVSQSKKTGTITVSDLTAKVVDSGQERVYTRFTKQTQANQSKELEFHAETSSFSKSASITITGTMKSDELGINAPFTKVVSGSAIDAAIQECPMHIGCDIRITDTEVINTITHNVTFKTEAGGKINGGTENINYTNVIDGSVFPEIPKTDADNNYEFVGWFDESGNQISNFPEKVTRDYVFVAKWKKVSENPTPVTPVAAAYFVKHYQEQPDGSYAEVKADAEKLVGKIGEEVTAKPKTYAGYTYNSSKSAKTAKGIVIKPEEVDGKLKILTLELYYDISEVEYKVEYYLQDGAKSENYTLKETNTFESKLGKTVKAEIKTFDKYQYNESKSTVTGKVVADGLTLKVYYDLKTVDPTPVTPKAAAYVVKHFQEQPDGSYAEVKADTEKLVGEIGKEVTAKPKKYVGYTYNSSKSAKTAKGIVIKPEEVDGKLKILTLELYYDISEVEYKVEYYLQDGAKSENYTLKETSTFVSKLGKTVKAEIKTFDKYQYNASKSTVTGKVVAEGLRLKVYYDLKVSDPGTNPGTNPSPNPGTDPGTKPNPNPGVMPDPKPEPKPEPEPTPVPKPAEEPTETPEPTEVPEPSTNPEPSSEKPKSDSNSKSDQKAKPEKVQNTENDVLTNVPRTGESNVILIVVVIAAISAIGIAWLFVKKSK